MGWLIRKSLQLLPGLRLNLSKSGPRLSVGMRGARVNIGLDGKARITGGAGPLRYQKTLSPSQASESSIPRLLRWLFR